jgi:hypothetical protein
LRLDGDDAPNGVDDIERLAPEEQLPGEGGPIELAGGQGHARILGEGRGLGKPTD